MLVNQLTLLCIPCVINLTSEISSFPGELLAENSEHPEIVAIKVLKESATREAEEDFLREVDIMSTFRHSNILSLLGVVLRGTYYLG